ncbi:MAG: type II toxin-antitoxin system VapC family toxin [Acidimicrobiales bacterium]|jgi:uncharacterized protein with PIN domain|nr:type II toxin-antitoxin system VapC family toxin [Acidimicrobiales bacterium]
MTLAVDTSALVLRYLDEPRTEEVLAAMEADPVWVASDLLRCEVTVLLHRLAGGPAQADELLRSFHADWDAFHVVPVDERCLTRAAEIGADFGLRVVDAVHLAAAARLPRPVRYLTLDPRQVLTAVALDLEPVPTPTE